LGNNLLSDLRNYFTQYKPQDYLFEGQNGGKYSPQSAANIFKVDESIN